MNCERILSVVAAGTIPVRVADGFEVYNFND